MESDGTVGSPVASLKGRRLRDGRCSVVCRCGLSLVPPSASSRRAPSRTVGSSARAPKPLMTTRARPSSPSMTTFSRRGSSRVKSPTTTSCQLDTGPPTASLRGGHLRGGRHRQACGRGDAQRPPMGHGRGAGTCGYRLRRNRVIAWPAGMAETALKELRLRLVC